MRENAGCFDVLVTDCQTRAGLAVARSLARRGVRVLGLCSEGGSPAFYSKILRNVIASPSAMHEPEAFVEFTLQTIRKFRIKLAIPITDQALILFDQYRAGLESLTRVAMASAPALRAALDKRINLELAVKLGVPCAKQFELTSLKQIPEMIATLGFPIVLKRPGDPVDKTVPAFSFRVLYAHNEAQLRGYLAEHCENEQYPLFQEMATGEIHNVCCFAVQGEILAAHEYQSIRRLEGAGVFRRIIEPSPDLLQHARGLLRAVRWDGVAHLGFFVDKKRDRVWYMETNGRFWASIQGSVHAGWDFPYWVYQYFLHGQRPNPGPIEMGSLTCWRLGDLLALLNFWRGGDIPASGTNPTKAEAALQYLSGFAPNVHSDLFAWDDPLPALVEYWKVRKRLWGMVQKRLTNTKSPENKATGETRPVFTARLEVIDLCSPGADAGSTSHFPEKKKPPVLTGD
jgi:predicted ATP-grasp superfamily ATP-dependent carboligase